MTGYDPHFRTRLGKCIEMVNGAADGPGIIHKQVGNAMRRAAFVDRARQPAPISGKKRVAVFSMCQHSDLSMGMSWERDQQQRPISKYIVCQAKSWQRLARKRWQQDGTFTEIIREQ